MPLDQNSLILLGYQESIEEVLAGCKASFTVYPAVMPNSGCGAIGFFIFIKNLKAKRARFESCQKS